MATVDQPMEDFRLTVKELEDQVQILVRKIQELHKVGPAYDVAGAVAEAKQAALESEASAARIEGADISTSEDAATAKAAALTSTTVQTDVAAKHTEIMTVQGQLASSVTAASASARAAASSADDALAAFQSATGLDSSAQIAATRAETALEGVNNGVALVEDVRASIDQLNENMAEAVEASRKLLELSALIGTSAFSSTYKFKEVPVVAGKATLDADVASVLRVNLTGVTTEIEVLTGPGSIDTARQLTVFLRQGTGSNKVDWKGKVRWANNVEPILSFTNGDEDVITLIKCATDSKFYGFFPGDSFSA